MLVACSSAPHAEESLHISDPITPVQINKSVSVVVDFSKACD